jgi:ATP-binding cassette subfamily B protein/ATP-binding cassette subfamily B protein RtxE
MGLIALIFTYVGGGSIFFVLMTISVVYIVFYYFLINWRRPYLSAVNAEEDQVCARLFGTLQAGKAIKLEQACDHALKPLCESYAAYAQAATKVASTGAILGSVRILYLGLTTAGLLAWGVQDQLSGSPRLSIGSLVAVFSIAGMFLNNFSNLAEAYRTLDQFLVDKRKLQDVLALDDLMESEQTSLALRISSLNLSPLHPETDRPLIFRAEQSVAIIGASGAGKTTLLETLAGIPKARRPHLGLNDRLLQPSQVEAYLNRVRYCPQSPVFLEGFFSHSVLFGQDVSSSLAHSIDALGLRELVSDRSISEGAKNISGGEAKRLSLLRLINRPGDFNLFDEPTASLDQESRLRVWDAVFYHFHARGLICVTHDLAALPRFDRVIVMKHGAVIADGPWFELEGDEGVAEIVTQIIAPLADL